MMINEAITLLQNYDGSFGLTLRSPASEELISKVEAKYGITLPADFKTFYRFCDGFETEEDMFNMISLDQILSHKEDEPIWIAEYMLYCDSWALEVNTVTPDQYSIFCFDAEEGKILLTNSLGEFVAKFLKGGVFDLDGLYALKDEIKARLYGNSDPKRMKPLLWVYRECLKRGLMTREDVVARADWIIATESEPDYFFIEMSLSQNVNELITVLDSIYLTEDTIALRAFLGVVYSKLLVNQITTDAAVSVLNSFYYRFYDTELFTLYEAGKMIELIVEADYLYDGMPDVAAEKRLEENVKEFFNMYRGFNIWNYKDWGKANDKLMEKLENDVA